MFCKGCLRGARSVSSFCDFRKMTFCDFTHFSPFGHKFCFFRYSWSIKAHLCPNINFDGVSFSERRSEEVMFLLTLIVVCVEEGGSVCVCVNFTKVCYKEHLTIGDSDKQT